MNNTENKDVCKDLEHTPPKMKIHKSGIQQHSCPTCGKIFVFIIPKESLK